MVNLENIKSLVFQGHLLIKNYQIYCLSQGCFTLNKLNSKEIYSFLIELGESQNVIPNCTKKFFFQNSNLIRKTIYVLPRIITKDSRL